MKINKLFEDWGITGLKLNLGFLETNWEPQVKESEAAWELYVELLTRIATQPLADDSGLEKSSLSSIYSLFGITREVLRRHGKDTIGFAKIAVIILNQVVRPFTARWHKLSSGGAFDDEEQCAIFRAELRELQKNLRKYMGMLSQIAGVEDISALTESPIK